MKIQSCLSTHLHLQNKLKQSRQKRGVKSTADWLWPVQVFPHTQTHINVFGSAMLLKLHRESIVPRSPRPLFRTGLLTVEWQWKSAEDCGALSMTGASWGFYNANNGDMDKGIVGNAPLADRAVLPTIMLQQINNQAWVARAFCFCWGICMHTVTLSGLLLSLFMCETSVSLSNAMLLCSEVS